MTPEHINIGRVAVPCRVRTGEVTVCFEHASGGSILEIDQGAAYEQFKLERRRTFNEGEYVSVIECDPHGNGRWRVVAIARHESRTWAFDVEPSSFLKAHNLIRDRLEPKDFTIAATAGLGTLALVASGVTVLLFTPILVPMLWIEAKKFMLRRSRVASSMRLLSHVDFISQAVIGSRASRTLDAR